MVEVKFREWFYGNRLLKATTKTRCIQGSLFALLSWTILFYLTTVYTVPISKARDAIYQHNRLPNDNTSLDNQPEMRALIFQRVKDFNDNLSSFRDNLLEVRGQKEWTSIEGPLKVLSGEDFISQPYKHFTTLALPWKVDDDKEWSSLNDTANLLVQKYYQWTVTQPLCEWITKNKTRNTACSVDVRDMIIAKSLEYRYHQIKPLKIRRQIPNLLYIHVAEDAVITKNGQVISKNEMLVPFTCLPDKRHRAPTSFITAPLKREVFVISQFWGEGFFHKMLENMPRIAPYLTFLREHEDILVHVIETGRTTAIFLELLGIKKNRLVRGVTRAHVVFVPQGTPCGNPLPLHTQLLSFQLRQALRKQSIDKETRSNLVLVKRSHSRHFKEASNMAARMKSLAIEFNLTFHLFPDNPLPSLPRTFNMFHKAAVVVAPHGAGISNVLFSQPGTLVVEGVCNPPHTNLCYLSTAHILGHRYHGILSNVGCKRNVDVSPKTMEATVRRLLTVLDTGAK